MFLKNQIEEAAAYLMQSVVMEARAKSGLE